MTDDAFKKKHHLRHFFCPLWRLCALLAPATHISCPAPKTGDLGSLQNALLLLKSIKLLPYFALCAGAALQLVETERILKPQEVKV